ncbi:MAG: hypothetical protein ACRCYQ_13030 [Nocardioides sp.]
MWTTSWVRRSVAVAAATGLTVTLGACGRSAEDKAEPEQKAKPAATDGGSGSPTDEPSSTQVEPGMGKDFDGILADVTTEDCPTAKGEVEAKGTVLNSKKDDRDILISVVWLKKNSGDSLAIDYVALTDVGAGDTKEWSVKADLPRNADRCVIAAKSNKVGTLES